MGSIIQQALVAANELSLVQKLVAVLVGVPVLAVLFNILGQLAPQDKSKPPVVFHTFPWIGSAVTYGMDPYKFLFDCRDKYGDVFTFILLGRKMTVALGPKGNNLSLGGKTSHVSAEDAYTHLTTPVFGEGVVYDCPNEMLMQQKKFIKHGLTTEALQSYAPLMAEETRNCFTNRLQITPANPTKRLEVLKVMQELIILTAGRTLQGKEVRASMDHRFAHLMEALDAGFTPINFMFPNLPLPSYRRRDKAQREMSDFYLSIMAKRRAGASDHDHDMIEALQGSVYRDGTPLSDRDIAHMMIAILMAGQHTSSGTTSWLLLELAHNQDIQQKLYDEQVKYCGNPDGTFRDVTYEDSKSFPLMDSCIRETLRIHAPIHTIMRKVMQDVPVPTSLASGGEDLPYTVPKGHFLVAAPGVSQMDPKIWDDSAAWRPERWTVEGGVAKAANDQYQAGEKVDYGFGIVSKGTESPYQPFGAGRHRCVGEQFAYLQVSVIVAEVIRKFKLTPATPEFPKTNYQTMVVLPLEGKVDFTLRQ